MHFLRSDMLFRLAIFILLACITGRSPGATNSSRTSSTTCQNDLSITQQVIAANKGGLELFQAGSTRGTWSGYVKKFAVGADQTGKDQVFDRPIWDAGSILTYTTLPGDRKVYTYNPKSNLTVRFNFDSLPPETQSVFNLAPNQITSDGLGWQRVRYLIGDRQLENATNAYPSPPFARREFVLGNITNSALKFAGGADPNVFGSSYTPFFAQFKTRPESIYIGANDGMLHAFSSETGIELFAYIPSPLLDKLPALTYPSTTQSTLMDGQMTIKEAVVGGSWKTVLACGLGSGAKGIFALDVTSPNDAKSDQRVLFEFTEKDDPEVGNVSASPSIIKLQPNQFDSHGEYFVAFPSGSNLTSTKGNLSLFLLSLNKNFNTPWVLNKDYFKLKISALKGGDASTNALTELALAQDVTGNTTHAYAGDQQGNIWRFEFKPGAAPNTIEPMVIFTAVDPLNKIQPVTTAPAISIAPDDSNLILFGAGNFLGTAGTETRGFQTSSFYAVSDTQSTSLRGYRTISQRPLAPRNLIERSSSTVHDYTVTGNDFLYGKGINGMAKRGWYIDFPGSYLTGEHSVSTPLITNGLVAFDTTFPSCPPTSRTYTLNLLTGKTDAPDRMVGKVSDIGIPGVPIVVTDKGEVGETDAIGQRSQKQYFSIIRPGTKNGLAPSVSIEVHEVQRQTGRLSWREIVNWQDSKTESSP